MIENIVYKNEVLSLIIRSNYKSEGIEFFTDDENEQQLAYMNRKSNYIIEPHIHNKVKREVFFTQETLVIKSGKVRVDYYSNDKQYLESRILNGGDVALLVAGGHGLKMLEDSEIIEIKQGPYVGANDKVRFTPVDENDIEVKL